MDGCAVKNHALIPVLALCATWLAVIILGDGAAVVRSDPVFDALVARDQMLECGVIAWECDPKTGVRKIVLVIDPMEYKWMKIRIPQLEDEVRRLGGVAP